MASNVHSNSGTRTTTTTLVAEAENQNPLPTLRLSRTENHETLSLSTLSGGNKKQKEEEAAKKQCEDSKNQILAQIKKALDDNVEKVRAYLKTQVPRKQRNQPEEEHEEEVANFKVALAHIKKLLQEYSDFNDRLIQSVGDYLVTSWNMIVAGASPEAIKRYRDEERKKNCAWYDQEANKLDEKIRNTLENKPTPTFPSLA